MYKIVLHLVFFIYIIFFEGKGVTSRLETVKKEPKLIEEKIFLKIGITPPMLHVSADISFKKITVYNNCIVQSNSYSFLFTHRIFLLDSKKILLRDKIKMLTA